MSRAAERLDREIDGVRRRLRELEELRDEFAPTPETENPVPLDEFLREEATSFDWLVGSEIARGTTGLLVADPKVGKTTLAVQLSLSLAAGRAFLGCNVYQTRTLYVAAEGARGAFQARVRTAARAIGVEASAVAWHIQPPGFIDFQITGATFRRLIDKSRAGFVVLDTYPFFAAQPYNVNDTAEWKAKVLSPLRVLTAETGATFLLIHHQGKATEKTGWQKVLGTMSQFGDCDFFWRLEGVEGIPSERALFVDGNKYAEASPMRVLDFDRRDATFRLVAGG